jgi:hypothetical protein
MEYFLEYQWNMSINYIIAWWFWNVLDHFSIQLEVILPFDELIFFRGVAKNHQSD